MSDSTVTSPEARHGRNRITSRAIRAVVSAVAAQALQAPAKNVSVELADANGGLRIIATAPIGVAALTTASGRPAAPGGPSILERAETARRTIGRDVSALTGSTIAAVDLRLSSAHIDRDRIDRPRADRARVDRPSASPAPTSLEESS
jgi:hypothetical protein